MGTVLFWYLTVCKQKLYLYWTDLFEIELFKWVVFTNGPGDSGSIPCRVMPKTQQKVLHAALLSTQNYKVSIKGKVGQSKESSSAFLYTSVW